MLTQSDNHEYNMHKLDVQYLTMTRYDDTYKNVEVLFTKEI
ncbi:MAG: hypothetical protein R2769_10965 [Saprospiraceae bacterium]